MKQLFISIFFLGLQSQGVTRYYSRQGRADYFLGWKISKFIDFLGQGLHTWLIMIFWGSRKNLVLMFFLCSAFGVTNASHYQCYHALLSVIVWEKTLSWHFVIYHTLFDLFMLFHLFHSMRWNRRNRWKEYSSSSIYPQKMLHFIYYCSIRPVPKNHHHTLHIKFDSKQQIARSKLQNTTRTV